MEQLLGKSLMVFSRAHFFYVLVTIMIVFLVLSGVSIMISILLNSESAPAQQSLRRLFFLLGLVR